MHDARRIKGAAASCAGSGALGRPARSLGRRARNEGLSDSPAGERPPPGPLGVDVGRGGGGGRGGVPDARPAAERLACNERGEQRRARGRGHLRRGACCLGRKHGESLRAAGRERGDGDRPARPEIACVARATAAGRAHDSRAPLAAQASPDEPLSPITTRRAAHAGAMSGKRRLTGRAGGRASGRPDAHYFQIRRSRDARPAPRLGV